MKSIKMMKKEITLGVEYNISNENASENNNLSQFPKSIAIKVEFLDEPIELTVEANTTIQEIIDKIIIICKEKNIDINEKAFEKLGTEKFSLIFMRK